MPEKLENSKIKDCFDCLSIPAPANMEEEQATETEIDPLTSVEMTLFCEEVYKTIKKDHPTLLCNKELLEIVEIFSNAAIGLVVEPLTKKKSPKDYAQVFAFDLVSSRKLVQYENSFSILLATIFRSFYAKKLLFSTKAMKGASRTELLFALTGCDTHAVTEIIIENFFKLAPSYLLVQDSVFEEIDEKITDKLKQITGVEATIGRNDQGAKTKKFGLYKILYDSVVGKCNYLHVVPFRTVAEAVKLSKSLPHACTATIWGCDTPLSLILAKNVDICTIWINSYGLFHPGLPPCRCNKPDLFCYVTKQTDRDFILKLIQMPKFEAYVDFALKFLVPTETVPSGVNVISETIGHVEGVNVYWRKGEEHQATKVVIAALAWGCKVHINFLDGAEAIEIAPLSELLGENRIKRITGTGSSANAGALFNTWSQGSAVGTEFPVDNTSMLSRYFLIRRHIWLPENPPL